MIMKEMICPFYFLKLALYENDSRPQCNELRYRVIHS